MIFASFPYRFFPILSVLLLTACVTTPQFRADPIEQGSWPSKVTILVSGRVIWPRMAGNEAGTDLEGSKQLVQRTSELIKSAFEAKRYRVQAAIPVGVGFRNERLKNNLIYPDYGKDGDLNHYNAPDASPVFIFPQLKENSALMGPSRNLFESVEWHIEARNLNSMLFSSEEVRVIAQAMGSDSVCLVRVYGTKFSDARKIGTLLLNRQASSTETLSLLVSCASAWDGSIVWQRTVTMNKDPLAIEPADIDSLLRFLPDATQPLPAECRPIEKNKRLYACDRT